MRLGFHDCIPTSDAAIDEVRGCDGCLNPVGIGINMLEYYDTDKGQYNGPDVTVTNNNGLLQVADILEEIYTNKDFPHNLGLPSLDVSMQESGKSRADLWAFATLMAAHMGIDQNNLACQGKKSSKITVFFYPIQEFLLYQNPMNLIKIQTHFRILWSIIWIGRSL